MDTIKSSADLIVDASEAINAIAKHIKQLPSTPEPDPNRDEAAFRAGMVFMLRKLNDKQVEQEITCNLSSDQDESDCYINVTINPAREILGKHPTIDAMVTYAEAEYVPKDDMKDEIESWVESMAKTFEVPTENQTEEA